MISGDRVYWICHSTIRYIYLQLVSGDIAGLNNIPRTGACILACNHASHLDPPLIGCKVTRKINFFARKTLWKPGFATWWLDTIGTIPVDRDGDSDISAMKRTLKTLKAGGLLTLFPEGTRTLDGNLQNAKPGIGLIAGKSQATVVPCRIFNTFGVLSRDSKFPDFSKPIHMVYGKPLSPEEFDPGRSAGKQRYQIIADSIMTAISKLERPRPEVI